MAGSKTSKLRDQIAKGILSGMETSLGIDTRSSQDESVSPAMPQSDSVLPGQDRSQSVYRESGKHLLEPNAIHLQSDGSASSSQTDPDSLSHAASVAVRLSVTELAAMKHVRDFLERELHIQERLWTGYGSRGKNNLKKIEGKIPAELVEEIRSLRGPVTHHLERAIRLYLLILNADE